MHYLIYLVAGLLGRMIPWVFGKMLLSLGIGFATYTGLSALMAALQQQVLGFSQNIMATGFQLMDVCGIWTGLSIIISAYATSVALEATKVVIKKV